MITTKNKIIFALFILLGIVVFFPIRVSAVYTTYLFWEDSAPSSYLDGGDILLDTQYPVSDYYVDVFTYSGGNERSYIRIYMQEYNAVSITNNFAVPFTIQNTNTIVPYRCYELRWQFWDNPNMWVISNYQPDYNTNTSYLINEYTQDVYIVKSTVPVIYNGQSYTPDPPFEDDFIFSKEDFIIHYGVSPTENSEQFSYYYRTQKYSPRFSFDVDSQHYYYDVPSNVAYYTKLVNNYNYTGVATDDIINMLEFEPTAYYLYDTYMQGVAFGDSLLSPFEDCTAYISFNSISLRQLLDAVNEKYNSSLTYNDLYTTITFEAFDLSGTVKYTSTVDFSSLYDSGVSPPPDDLDMTDQTEDKDLLNQYLISNNNLLQQLIDGKPYIKQSYDGQSIGFPDGIDIPDFDYTTQTFDTRSMGLFEWIVNLFFGSPFSIIFFCALSFLIIRTILW